MNAIPNQVHQYSRYPRLRWIGHALGVIYLLVTLLFGPIKLLARWLAQQQLIQHYQRWVAGFPPVVGLAVSLLSLGFLELSKIAVLLSYRSFGLWVAVGVTFCAKASLGYFAHLTWQATRPNVISAYPWVARIDTWVGIQLTQLRGIRTRWAGYLKSCPWYPGLVTASMKLRHRTARWVSAIKNRLAILFANQQAP